MPNRFIEAAIIDDGVHLGSFPQEKKWIVDENLDISLYQSHIIEENHAAVCMGVMQKYVDMEHVFWHSIKVLKDDTKRGYIGRFLKALELCEELGVKLIHLSIGSTCYEDFRPIQIIVERLLKKGVILVSATSNEGVVTYPAYISNVISVKCDPQLTDDAYTFQHDPIERISFQASSRHQLGLGGQKTVSSVCNSYAAPLITAKVISHLINDPKLNCEKIIPLLIAGATNSNLREACSDDKDKIDFPNNAMLDSPDIPIVVLSGFDSQHLIDLICELSACLKTDDYNVRVALEHPLATYLDMTPVRVSTDIENYVRKMNSYFNCEIILLGFSPPIQPERCRSASLWIWGTEQGYEVPEDQVGIIVKNESGQALYEKMLSILL